MSLPHETKPPPAVDTGVETKDALVQSMGLTGTALLLSPAAFRLGTDPAIVDWSELVGTIGIPGNEGTIDLGRLFNHLLVDPAARGEWA